MKRKLKLLVGWGTLLTLQLLFIGCGQKGALVLPQPEQPAEQEARQFVPTETQY